MQQILRKCSEYSENRILGTALVCANNSDSLFLNCINGFELFLLRFSDCFIMQTLPTSAKVCHRIAVAVPE